MGKKSIRVPYGGTAIVTLSRAAKARKGAVETAPATTRGGYSENRNDQTGRARVGLFDLDVIHFPLAVPTGDGDFTAPANTYRARSMETTLGTGLEERLALNSMLLAARGDTVTSTGRVIPKAWPLPVGADTDGVLARVSFTNIRSGETATLDPLGETDEWQQEVSVEERITETEALLASTNDPVAKKTIVSALARLRARRDEVWSVRLGRVGKTGTGALRLGAGQFDISVETPFHYENFGGATATRYTAPDGLDDNYADRAQPQPRIGVGWDSSATVEIGLVPRRHVIYVGWWTSYYMVSLWANLVIWMPNQRRFRDRLPWDPPFSFSAGADNGAAMSGYLPETRAYAEMLAQDLLPVRATLYFQLLLIGRMSGRWIVFESSQFPGELTGLVRIRYPSGFVEEKVAWRDELRVVAANVQISGGRLVTTEVSPDLGIYSFVLPGQRPPPAGVLADPLPMAA